MDFKGKINSQNPVVRRARGVGKTSGLCANVRFVFSFFIAFPVLPRYNNHMDKNDLRRVSPVPWTLVVLLGVLLAGLVLLRLLASPAAAPEVIPSPVPTAEPTPGAAETMLADMTLREKLCQLLVVEPQVLAEEKTVTAVDEQLTAALEQYPVCGLMLTGENIKTADQLKSFTREVNRLAPGVLICVDEEGGRVARLMNTVGTTKLNNMYSYRNDGTQTAYKNGWILGQDLCAFGFNTDFAPVADVWTSSKTDVIGNRAYSDDYDQAAELVASAVRGFRDGGVLCCLKHFPGHGSTETDSHEEAAVVDKDLNTLRREDLKPFVSGISAGADMVMVGHLSVPALDDVPASMSHRIITGLLREELSFGGVIVTDGLQMKAAGAWTDGEKAVKCLSAGADLLLEIEDVPGTIAALEQAVKDGKLTEQRIDESVLRILQMKLDRGIL